MGCDGCTQIQQSATPEFQSTHPHGVRLSYGQTLAPTQSFNPRTHMGCDLNSPSNFPELLRFNPRTHMGCDNIYVLESRETKVSIHAPTWGATLSVDGSDIPIPVSIHAPTWGATNRSCSFTDSSKCFNPRTHMGCDLTIFQHNNNYLVSIHAPTWGATERDFSKRKSTRGFNPRTHMGCDVAILEHLTELQSFNPRTHMGCDVIVAGNYHL